MSASPSSNNEASRLTTSFNTFAHTYERRAGGATRAVAAHIVSQLPLNDNNGSSPPRVLDNACGTAAVTGEILKVHPVGKAMKIDAVDGSAGMVEIVKEVINERDWAGRVEARVMDGQDLSAFEDARFDISVTNFGIFFFPDPEMGAREIYRTLKPGGTAVVTCWKELGLVPLLYACQDIIKPKKEITSLPVLEKWMQRETIESAMKAAGFQDVKIERFGTMIGISSSDESEMIFGAVENLKGIVGDQWSEEEKGELKGAAETLLNREGEGEEEGGLFVEMDGKRGVPMVAWIATCKK